MASALNPLIVPTALGMHRFAEARSFTATLTIHAM